MKRFILIALAMMLCLVGKAESWTDSNGTTWKYGLLVYEDNFSTYSSNGNYVIIQGVSGTIPNNLVIPTTIGGKPVRAISSLSCNSSSITIPDGVTFIRSFAFQNCSALTTIVIPNGVTSIENYTFDGCSGLTSIVIPNGVISIGDCAFRGCSSLTSISIPSSVISIGNSAFSNCSGLTSIVIPSSVTSIGDYAFGNSYFPYIIFEGDIPAALLNTNSLWYATLIVPDDAVAAYKTAWPYYQNMIVGASDNVLKTVNVTAKESESDLANQLGENNLLNITKLKISGTINSYDMMILRNKMINLRELDMKDVTIVANDYEYYTGCKSQNNVFGANFFRETNIYSIVLPDNITSIGGYAFYHCYNIRTIHIPENVTSLGTRVFDTCSNLKSINIPVGVRTIPYGAFQYCHKLSEIRLSPQTISIEGSAFGSCYNIIEMHLPPYLQFIGDNAFSYCDNLKKIYAYMPDIPNIQQNSFNNYKHQNLYVPNFLYNSYYYNTQWSQFLGVYVCELQPGDYTSFYTNSDVVFGDGERIDQDTPDVEIGEQGGVIVEGDTPQNFDDVEQNVGDTGGSIIGEGDNIIVNKLKLKLQVKANEWIGFNFPYDVTIADCEYPGQYVWIEYDGEARANGNSGWRVVTSEKLTANKGYMFMSSAKGKLIVTFDHPSFGGDKEKPLQSYTSGNAANAGWNFIGNPYSSYYALDENDFSAPITIWNGTSYEAYRPGDDDIHLQPYQAFFVQMPQHVYVVNFDKDNQETYTQSQQTQANQAKMRKVAGIKPERLLINLTISDNDTTTVDKTRLVLNEKASRGYELECDAAKFISDKAEAQLYLLENGVQMAIDERPTKGDICLGYMAKQAGKLRIEATRMDMPMVLVDTKTHQTFDLSLGNYEFETEAGTYDKRFMLRLSEEATAIKSLTAKTGVAVGLQDGGLSFGGAEGKSISIYNANGMLMTQQSGNGFVSLPSGLYLVKVDEISAKIYVK